MSVLVGRPAPDFTAAAVLGSGEIVDAYTLSDAIKGKPAASVLVGIRELVKV